MSQDWIERPEIGTRGIITFSVVLVRRVGRTVARWLLAPASVYFFLSRGPERRASRAFLSRAFGRPAHWWEVLRHHYVYSATILDRAFLLSESFRGFHAIRGLAENFAA